MSKNRDFSGNLPTRSPAKPGDDSGPQWIGYARVSTDDQNLELQTRALNEAGCLNIYEEKLSGAKATRPQLDLAIKDLRPGDTFVVWRLDRLSRSITDLYQRLAQIEAQGAHFISLTERFDFSTATGKLILGFLGLMAEFERQLTRERTKAGMAVMREKGIKLGASIKFTKEKQREVSKMLKAKERRNVRGKMVWRKKFTIKQIAKKAKISAQTIFVYRRDKRLK